jgi:hypothetical protein
MKTLHKLTVTAVAAMAMSSASAAGLSGVLDGMFTQCDGPGRGVESISWNHLWWRRLRPSTHLKFAGDVS